MALPGTDVLIRENPPTRVGLTDYGASHGAGLTTRGPVDTLRCESQQDVIDRYGDPTVTNGRDNVNALLLDSTETIFNEGGGPVYVTRCVGPAALPATLNLSDGTATTFVVSAGRETKVEPGAWGNSLRIQIVDVSGARQLVVSHATLGELERSGAYTVKADLLAWAATSRYITLVEGAGTGLPSVLAATALTGGTDDRAAITDVHRVAAINRNNPDDNGPGVVAYWGATAAAVRAGVTAHCLASGGMRVAALDAVDTTSPTTAAADGLTMRTDTGAGLAAMLWPWTNVAGITPGTFRAIPPSATAMGIVGRNSKAGVTPNQAPAGKYGESRTAVSLRSQATVTDTDRTTLNNGGVTLIRAVRGGFRIYGARTIVDPVSRPLQAWWSNAILYMAIVAKAYDVMEDYVLRVVDGQGLIFSDLNRDLTAIVKPYWEDGSLFGATFADAALVVTDASVNTPARLALGELHAVVAVRPGPPAERVVLELVKTGITTNLAG